MTVTVVSPGDRDGSGCTTVKMYIMPLNCALYMVKMLNFVLCIFCYCCCWVTQSCQTLCHPMDCNMPRFPFLNYLPGFAQTHVHWVDDAIQPTHSVTLISSCLQSFPASGSSPLSWLLASGGQSIGFSISPSTEYSGLISFRIDWFDLLVVQGTLRNLLQYRNSKASILQCSALFMFHLSHLYMTTGQSCVWLFATLWTVASQAPLSLGFARQKYWNGLLFPSPGDPPNPGIEPTSLNVSCIDKWIL